MTHRVPRPASRIPTSLIVDPVVPRPSLADVYAARDRLRGVAVRTPLLPLHEHPSIRLKPELLQPMGSFKVRGVYNALAAMSDAQRARGVTILSSGNAAQALAWSARRLGVVRVRAIMPANAPRTKVDAFRALGGEVELRDPEHVWDMLLDRSYVNVPGIFIHPTANPHVVAGYGAIALESLEDLPDVATIYVPVGGGGLLAGIANVVATLAPRVRVVGVQPSGCAPIIAGVAAGEPVATTCETFCDGVAGTFMDPDTWPLLRDLAGQIDWVTVDDDATRAAIRRLAMGNKVVAEGAGALALAAALEAEHRGQVVAILSGGSIDPEMLTKALREI
ncbi:MAG TPA: pyridoxal-phosphate dependent enzyme [Thermomicrobiales bacterium]|nr:pyridoxal-phosphate dependent enzyme [Thermomicrobiales bacterium]